MSSALGSIDRSTNSRSALVLNRALMATALERTMLRSVVGVCDDARIRVHPDEGNDDAYQYDAITTLGRRTTPPTMPQKLTSMHVGPARVSSAAVTRGF